MALYLIKRIGSLLLTLVLVMIVMFMLITLSPGDPAVVAAGPDATAEQIEAARQRLGLDAPLLVQFWTWFAGVLTGDLGSSFVSNRPVLGMITERLGVTTSLVALALLLSLVISLPLGINAAVHRDTIWDRLSVLWASLGIALPEFFVGLMLVLVLALNATAFPATGYVPFLENPSMWLWFMFLPALTLAVAVAAELTRHIRASLSDVLELDYVRTARAKGLGSVSVIGKHSLRNAALPVVTVFGNQVARLIGGTVIVEQIFNLPGIGQLIVQAIFQRDITTVLGVGIFVAIVVLIINFLVDLSYGWLNPKVRS